MSTFNPTPEQRHALIELADLLMTVAPEKFDMSCYRESEEDHYNHYCESVGCALGWAPNLINWEDVPRDIDGEINFEQLSFEMFGIENNSHEFRWCFSWTWEDVDNTPNGAAKRIFWLLANGLPENWRDQMRGDVPLCYIQ